MDGLLAPQVGPQLRHYQVEVIAEVKAEIAAGKRRLVLVAPTGSGKTIVACAGIAEAVATGHRVLILVHRRELIAQISAKLYAVGVGHGIIAPGFPSRPGERVQVASIQTLHARAVRTARIDLPAADLVIVDECHHCRAMTYRKIIDAYPQAIVIGLTATPCRGDGRGLGNVFETIIECPSVAELIEQKYLVGTVVYAPTRPDLKGVKVQAGDYAQGQLEVRMDTQQLVGGIVEHWLKLAGRKSSIVYASGVGHSIHLRDEFRKSGVLAEHIDGSTPVEERDAILARLAAGTVEVVCNFGVLTEGFDCPVVGCIVLARPTRHHGLYRQMVGRGLRQAPGKTSLLVLDHAGAVFQHGFVEEEVIWTLREDRRAALPMQGSRSIGRAPKLVTCPECSAVRWQGKPCPACGWRPQPKAESFAVRDGDLGKVDRNRRAHAKQYNEDEKERFYRQLLWIARERNYKPGWAAYKYREKFGHWPPFGSPGPMEPDAAMRAWVRSRQISFAKSMQARRSA
jgi:superfamily II DNA or RNA helicase